MTLIKGNIANGNSDSVELRKKMVDAEKAEKDNEMQTFQKTVDNLSESIEEFTDILKEMKEAYSKPKPSIEYFDKDQNSKLIQSIDKVFSLLQKFKQPDIKIDLAPINNIATEIKNQNSNIIALINKNNNGQNEQLQRLIIAMVEKQNLFLDREFKQMDYSEQFNSINETLNKKNDKVEKLTVVRGEFNLIKEVIPIYKNNK